MDTSNYKTEKCAVAYLSDICSGEAEALIGKVIDKIKADEHELAIMFTDNSTLLIIGSRWNGCALGIELIPHLGET